MRRGGGKFKQEGAKRRAKRTTNQNISECKRPDDDATDENHRQRAQKNATHSFSSSLRVFVWSFEVLSSHREREEKRSSSSLLRFKIFKFKSHAK